MARNRTNIKILGDFLEDKLSHTIDLKCDPVWIRVDAEEREVVTLIPDLPPLAKRVDPEDEQEAKEHGFDSAWRYVRNRTVLQTFLAQAMRISVSPALDAIGRKAAGGAMEAEYMPSASQIQAEAEILSLLLRASATVKTLPNIKTLGQMTGYKGSLSLAADLISAIRRAIKAAELYKAKNNL